MFDLTLTFDNGPTAETTPEVLDLLAARGIKATFFVVGQRLAEPGALDLARRARAEGHRIGNHTWSHGAPLGVREEPDLVARELERTQALIDDLADGGRLFRPNGGGGIIDTRLLRPDVVDYLERGGFTCVLWNSVPRDWVEIDGWVETALDHCRSQPWTLMVLHDLPTGAMRHLPGFLDRVAEAGGRIRQDFPPDCTPIVDGRAAMPLEPYVTRQ